MLNHEVKHGTSRPGGRTEEVRLAVAEAVLSFLKEGNSKFSMSDVAKAAGIHRSTLYRRWESREELIHEATTLHVSKINIPDSGSWEEDIYNLVRNLAEFASDPVEIAIIKAMIDPENKGLSEQNISYWVSMMEWHTLPIKNAIKRGDISRDSDPGIIFSMLLSPLILNALVTGNSLSPANQDKLVQMIIKMTAKQE